MCALQDSDRVGTHREAAAPRRMLRDDDDVSKLLTVITSWLMTDPFSLDEDAVCSYRTSGQLFEIGTARSDNKVCGTETEYQQHNILGFPPKSEDQDICFTGQEENGETGLWDKVIVINADRELYGRLVIAANSRVINLKMSLDKSCQQFPSP